MTVEPASAVPVIFGELLFAGPAGEAARAVGAAGAAVSIVIDSAPEATLVFPAASVAFAVMLCAPSLRTLEVIE